MQLRAGVPRASLLISPSESGALSSNPEEKLKQPSILSAKHRQQFVRVAVYPAKFVSGDDSQHHLCVQEQVERCYNPAGIKMSAWDASDRNLGSNLGDSLTQIKNRWMLLLWTQQNWTFCDFKQLKLQMNKTIQ